MHEFKMAAIFQNGRQPLKCAMTKYPNFALIYLVLMQPRSLSLLTIMSQDFTGDCTCIATVAR